MVNTGSFANIKNKYLSGLPRDLSASVLRPQQKLKRLINLDIDHHAVLQAILTVGELHECGPAALANEIKTQNFILQVFFARYTKLVPMEIYGYTLFH